MGHWCSKEVVSSGDGVSTSSNNNNNNSNNNHRPQTPSTGTPAAQSFTASPWQSPYPAGIAPSPMNRTPGRKFRWPLPPPSPAKPIMSAFLKRHKPTQQQTIDEAPSSSGERALDKSFGYSKNIAAKFELGKEVGRGHFGHTCWAKGKKGELKNQQVAVKIISKTKMTTAIAIEDVRREVKILKALSGH